MLSIIRSGTMHDIEPSESYASTGGLGFIALGILNGIRFLRGLKTRS
jgi:hypothetical protein